MGTCQPCLQIPESASWNQEDVWLWQQHQETWAWQILPGKCLLPQETISCLKTKPNSSVIVVWKWSHTTMMLQTALSLFENGATHQFCNKQLCHCLKMEPHTSSATNSSVIIWKWNHTPVLLQTALSLFKNGATHQFCYKLFCHCCLKMKPHNNTVTNCSVIVVWKWSQTAVQLQTALSLLFENEATQQCWTNCSVIVV